MNKRILVTLLLTAMFGKSYAENCNTCEPCETVCPISTCRCAATSQTFFFVRPEYQAGMPERTTLWHDRMLARDGGRGGAIQIVPFGGRTTRSSDLAAYFSINCQSALNVSENFDAPYNDILSPHLNIYTNAANEGLENEEFQSQICFQPSRSVGGVGFTYRQGFARRDDGRGFFFVASFPIERVKTSMHLGETVYSDGNGALECATIGNAPYTPADTLSCPLASAVGLNGVAYAPVANACQAFSQPAWAFGRIDNNSSENHRTGVADVDLLIGYDLTHGEHCYMSSYGGVLAPTGNRPNGITMFEPIIGHNHHTTIRWGGSFGAELWTHKTKNRNIWFDFQSEFFFHLNNTQVRSFDVKNKPWSRYMQVYSSFEQAQEAFVTGNPYLHTPGINVFTQQVKVNAGTARTYQSAFIFNNEGFEGELGYTFFARPDECVELECTFPQGVAFKAIDHTYGQINNVQIIGNAFNCINVNPFANGVTNPEETYMENTITDADLNLNSAAHPGMQTYIIYASMGNRWDDRDYPLSLGGGGSYEFSKNNTGMTRWLLWAKCAVSF